MVKKIVAPTKKSLENETCLKFYFPNGACNLFWHIFLPLKKYWIFTFHEFTDIVI